MYQKTSMVCRGKMDRLVYYIAGIFCKFALFGILVSEQIKSEEKYHFSEEFSCTNENNLFSLL